ncbi:hypothetical protein QJ527_12340 [Enterococcus mundtii]|uniref:hypothetical protein n=1 Tax=Enterococcus TaxID=1350 RepID=UPI000451B719|nr:MULTISPECIES: hypothetical protein [Enterococcus]AZP93939.1 hypothetical protein CYK55_13190 [Enterococcus mundtii]EYT95192.1 hypothetical protein AK89_09795 [Enterococcus mundtii CRL35]MDA9429329.1 hypothetical protein [Enterococcus mundtii 1A]MDK4212322.1 hypothetical protein [Enterococcus mundtii]MDO7880143.1 hypothetical protein [Enterococcus mundtii]
MRKQYTTELTKLTVIEIVTRLSEKKENFSFRDIEEEYQQPLTPADKFLIRCLIVKNFNLKIEYFTSSKAHQLQFCQI